MAVVIEPLAPSSKSSISTSSMTDPTDTVMTIRAMGTASGGTTDESTKANVFYSSGLAATQIVEEEKKRPKNPSNIASDRFNIPKQAQQPGIENMINVGNPAYRICKNTKAISKLHMKRYGRKLKK